ncbi:hypothetical protein [Galbitalea soli]|uniref:Uncharacterized protein n=1 Tax=Galbitalea soli TaxID=1268042 RepID=A0A7C9TQJ9_9MICO|nr:hypothetical protein [Galbitalea soli]NEM90684.1 hypothetical protein [Galbitalea soli]NYJ31402.1 hypothetical protein [Galbitalea soli]
MQGSSTITRTRRPALDARGSRSSAGDGDSDLPMIAVILFAMTVSVGGLIVITLSHSIVETVLASVISVCAGALAVFGVRDLSRRPNEPRQRRR